MRTAIALLVMALFLSGPKLATAGVGVDGSWFDSSCFGCPSDKVKDQLLEAQDEMDTAEKALESDRSNENLENAIDAALFSYVKAGHALELGDNYAQAGDTANARKWYEACVEYSDAALAMKDNAKFVGRDGKNVPAKSHAEGKKWKGYAQRHLAKLGGTK